MWPRIWNDWSGRRGSDVGISMVLPASLICALNGSARHPPGGPGPDFRGSGVAEESRLGRRHDSLRASLAGTGSQDSGCGILGAAVTLTAKWPSNKTLAINDFARHCSPEALPEREETFGSTRSDWPAVPVPSGNLARMSVAAAAGTRPIIDRTPTE